MAARKLPIVLPFNALGFRFLDMRSLDSAQHVKAQSEFIRQFDRVVSAAGYNAIKLCEADGIDADVLNAFKDAWDIDNTLTLDKFVQDGATVKTPGDYDLNKPSLMLMAKKDGNFVGGISLSNMVLERDDTLIRVKAFPVYGMNTFGANPGTPIGKVMRWLLANDLVTRAGRPNIDIVELTMADAPNRRWNPRKFAGFLDTFSEISAVADRSDYSDGTGDPSRFRRRGVS